MGDDEQAVREPREAERERDDRQRNAGPGVRDSAPEREDRAAGNAERAVDSAERGANMGPATAGTAGGNVAPDRRRTGPPGSPERPLRFAAPELSDADTTGASSAERPGVFHAWGHDEARAQAQARAEAARAQAAQADADLADEVRVDAGADGGWEEEGQAEAGLTDVSRADEAAREEAADAEADPHADETDSLEKSSATRGADRHTDTQDEPRADTVSTQEPARGHEPGWAPRSKDWPTGTAARAEATSWAGTGTGALATRTEEPSWNRPTGVSPITRSERRAAEAAAARKASGLANLAGGPGQAVWALTRVLLGFVFLWAFLDKLFGLDRSTARADAWRNGGSPTSEYLDGVDGPFGRAFGALGGQAWVDWLFMIGLAAIGVALILGVGMTLAAIAGTILLLLMWAASLPIASNPFVDDHLIYALVLIGIAATGAGLRYSLAPWWRRTGLVRALPFLR
jgi:thiosulfate dehydrogenase [quinone] large subunit